MSTLVEQPASPAVNGSFATPEPTTNGTHPALVLEPDAFKAYLLLLVPALLGASPEELEATLFDSEFEERVARFSTESGGAIYVSKLKVADVDEDATPTYTYQLTQQLTYTPQHVSTVALIKRGLTLDPLQPLHGQLQVLNLFGGDETPYESLHAVVSQGVKAWFDAFVETRGGAKEGDGKMGIPATKKKFAELELSLRHLQQNVEIPETHLIIHPIIQRAVQEAQATGVRPNLSLIPNKTLNDSTFLNTLQSHVNSWIKSIQSVTKLTRDVSSGTASQEINFWLSLESALDGIEAQLRSEEVTMVQECLRNAKRFRATVSLIADTGLKESTDEVRKNNILMRDFPLNELLSATDLDKIQESLLLIFGHMNKKMRLSPYPIRRCLPLVEAISRDFNDQMLRVLTSHRLAYQPYDSFERLLSTAQSTFRTWDEQIKDFTNVARELTRKRGEKFIPIKIVPAHAKLQERVRYLQEWRKKHEQLAVMTGPTKGLSTGKEVGDIDMEEEVKEAYELIKGIDILDVSDEGTEIWVTAENAYNERVARVENQIISRLRDRLGTARNANEMFRVFSKFNALFVRQKIRGAISEYQTQLIDSVKEDIKRLHDKFKTQYRFSEAYHMSQMRDLPPIAGAIIWARQIDRQLQTYMKRVEDVLGSDYEYYAQGQKLQQESASFRKKLETRPVFEAWLMDINRRDLGVSGRLFEIVRLRGGGFALAVNFDPQTITLFKEVRNLQWLNFQVPHAITNLAKDAKRVYPHAVSLMETVRTYGQTLDLIENNKGIEMLVAEHRNEAQNKVTQGINLRWDYFVNAFDTHRYLPAPGIDSRDNRHVQYVRDFASVVSVLQDKTNTLIDVYKDIMRIVEELQTCPYTTAAFTDLLGKIQASIDKMNLEGYANLENWVADLDKRIESILLARLQHIIVLWCTEFERSDEDGARREPLRDMTNKRRDKRKDDKHQEGELHLKPIIHEIRIQNQVIFLDPPIEHARQTWVKQLHEWLSVICNLRRIQSSRYEIGLQMSGAAAVETTYTSLLTRFDDATLERPFALIETKVQELKDYVAKWLRFQSLWDLQAEYVFNKLGDSLAHWQQLLTEIKKARSTFDTSETQKSFGVCVIDYEQVQSRVNAKYDAWQKDILSRFGVKLGNAMKEMHAAILKARNELEHHSIEGLVGAPRRF